MANERIPVKRGREIEQSATVLIGGQSFDGWEQINIQKSLESVANTYSIRLFDKFAGLRRDWPLKPGVSVKVNIGRERVLTGRIERLSVEYNDERRGYAISGRSNPGDLVDCTHTGENEFKDINLTELARKLVSPFGIRVFESVVPSNIQKFAVKPGETVFEALDRAARLQGLFFISTRGGNIRLTRAARARAFTTLEQGVNILSASATFDDSKRFRNYFVKGQSVGLPEFFGKDVAQPEGSAQDLGVSRHRPLTVIAEGNVDSAKAKTRAQWEASSRLAKTIRVQASVQGWLQNDGSLWGINQVVRFRSRFLGLDRELLITEINHTDGSDQGKATSMTLVDPQAYTTSPVLNKKESDDILKDLGANFK